MRAPADGYIRGDRSDQERVERLLQALKDSEERFLRLADALPQIIWESDGDGEMQYVNQRWVDYSGLTFEQARDKQRNSNLFHPDDAEIIGRAWADARATHTPMQVEGRLRRHDGEYRWFLIRTEPVIENGRAVRWFGTSTDITQLKEAEARISELADVLRRRLHEQETLLAALPVGVFIAHDAACTNISMNPAGAAILRMPFGGNASKTGPDREQLPFRLFKDGVEIPDQDLPMQRAARLGRAVMGEEMDVVFTDGAVATLFEHARPLFDEAGRVRGCVGVFVDMTAQKRAEHALKDAARRKDEFLAVLAHELRNPLAALAGAAQLLTKASDQPAIAAIARDGLHRQVDHMARLLDDLLEVSRITHGIVQLRKEVVNIVDAVDAAVETARPNLDARRHRLTLHLPDNPTYIEADRIRITQVLWNLLSNAAKYTNAGGAIDLYVRAEKEHVVIAVRDNGIGIAPDILPHVFEMFSQAAPALEHSEGGLGIGLSLVRGLIQLHGGTVEANSAGPGHGSEFIVRLPRARGPISRTDTAPRVSKTLLQAKRPLRVLIADDNSDSANSWAVLLEMSGHVVRTAFNGRDALHIAATFHPEIALLDIGMPELNGYEVAKGIRESSWGAATKLIAITGWGQEHDKEDARTAGFHHHFTKPVDMADIEPILSAAMLREAGA